MVDLTKRVRTRDGRPVVVVCTNKPKGLPVVGYYEDTGGVTQWHADGTSGDGTWSGGGYDLINVPEKHRYYAVLPKAESCSHGAYEVAPVPWGFKFRETAEAWAKEHGGIVVPVEWEE